VGASTWTLASLGTVPMTIHGKHRSRGVRSMASLATTTPTPLGGVGAAAAAR